MCLKKKKKNSGGPGGKHRGNHKHGIGANAKPIINAVGKTGIENTDFQSHVHPFALIQMLLLFKLTLLMRLNVFVLWKDCIAKC